MTLERIKIFLVSALILISLLGLGLIYSNFNYSNSQNIKELIENKIGQNSKNTEISGGLNALVPNICVPNLNFSLVQTNFKIGDIVDYSLVITNKGALRCKNASVSVYYQNKEIFVESNPRANAGNYYWRLGDLKAGETKNINIKVKYLGTIIPKDVQTEACLNTDNAQDVCSNLIVNAQINDTTQVVVNPVVLNQNKEYGSWIWVSPTKMTDSYKKIVIDGALANKINTLYITIDDYLDIANLPEGVDKENKKKIYSDALEAFVKTANQNGIAVDAEAGWRDWAEPNERYKAYTIVDYLISYNNTRSAKIRALQYDVEPYLLATYNTNKIARLSNFVGLIDETVKKMSGNNLKLSIVIPHFYDDTQKWTPAFNYGGVTDYTFNHLVRIMDKKEGSMIILMSYRNFALGDNGSIEISNAEINLTSEIGHGTKVIVAQETGNVDPGFVTFFGLSKQEYLNQISIINKTFEQKSGFGGIAVHYIDPFLELR